MKSKVWFAGVNSQTKIKKIKLHQKNFVLTEINDHIVEMCGSNFELIYYTKDNIFHALGRKPFHGSLFTSEEEKNKNSIVQVTSGFHHNLILTKTGRAFAFLGNLSCGFKEVYNIPTELDFFPLNGLKVTKIAGGEFQSYFLCENGDLFALGFKCTANTQKIKKKINYKKSKVEPLLICQDVLMLHDGNASRHNIYLCKDYTLWFQGAANQIKLENTEQNKQPIQIKNLDNRNIRQICIGYEMSVIVIGEDKVYTCGNVGSNGHNNKVSEFTQLRFFEGKPIEKVRCGCSQVIVLTKENTVYGFGHFFSSSKLNLTPIKINIPDFNYTEKLSICCGEYFSTIYTVNINSLANDFLKLYKSQEFTDYEINKIKIHRSFLEFRLDCEIEKISEFLKKYSKEETNFFLMWAYSDTISNLELINNICNHFGIEDVLEKQLTNDLLKLYKDEESKDFNVLVQDDEDDEDEEDEDGEEFEKIPVHKFILQARSGLFRDMFRNISEGESIKSVTDYSGKSVDSLEILIKYFYIDKIEITADNDPELTVEELSDAKEYYQLNEDSQIHNQLQNLIPNN
ncbi:btk-binding protein-related [Anaeramoeba flamelloides]|uniref:Btk-binding protein-related n=1 Tax=Anaeramoeba flamelloides TaxID=1746091 RepID=A0ABQ8Y5C5_9EUKA|nr:btk-binding protein-related [Anaeramoeba flamelloides]